ncbi:MAG: ABC transporter ATP-binding protein [Acidobacteria bacterium]|nr:ABC transporter ATP-binding protein [Acidobacteriota bacterium]
MIVMENLRKTYGPIVAVDDFSLEIRRGEVFGLLGPNGAGKTTLVHLAVGLLEPDHGRVEIHGLGPPTDPAVRARIGVAPQALALYEDLTGEENLAFFGNIQGLFGRDLPPRVGWSLDFVGLNDRRRDKVKTYSGGMKRRLNLAVALVHDPEIILLDEPTVGVDPQSRNAIFERIEALRVEGRTIIYTTHYMEEAQRLCDRVGIMDHGRLLAMDSVKGLLAAHGGHSVVVAETAGVEIRLDTDDPLAELTRLQREHELLRFTVESPNLEGVFLNLTGRRLRD